MRIIKISNEQNGLQIPVGTIKGEDENTAVFQYDSKYLERNNPHAISFSLPLKKECFTAEQTKNFFDGLLPEGFTRRSVAQWMHADENDYLTILSELGKECLGG